MAGIIVGEGCGNALICLFVSLTGLWLGGVGGLSYLPAGAELGEKGREEWAVPVGGAYWPGDLTFSPSWVEFGWMGFGTSHRSWESIFPSIFLPTFSLSSLTPGD